MNDYRPAMVNGRNSKVDPDFAFNLYAGMPAHGPEKRSIARLVKVIAEMAADGRAAAPVSYATLGRWSSQYKWRERVERHDELVQAGVDSRVVDMKVEQQFDEIEALNRIVQGSLVAAQQLLSTELARIGNATKQIVEAMVDGETTLKTEGTTKELKDLVQAATAASQQIELLSGRPTRRTEVLTPEQEDETLDRLKRKLEQRKVARQQLADREPSAEASGTRQLH